LIEPDSAGAVAALRALVDVIKNEKKSVVMAPEGIERCHGWAQGLRKERFHLAMQAGVRNFPIVLHDAIDIAPKGVFVYRPHGEGWKFSILIDTRRWVRKDYR